RFCSPGKHAPNPLGAGGSCLGLHKSLRGTAGRRPGIVIAHHPSPGAANRHGGGGRLNPPSPPSTPAHAGQSFFGTDTLTAYEAKCQAQRIAFAPMVFQACRVLLVTGVLELVRQHGTTGAALDELTPKASLPRHGLKVLLEAGLGIGLFSLQNERFVLTKLGYFMLRDSMTRINLEVVHEVCYRGMFHLETAVREERPAGLKTLGDWPTFYEGLASLTSAARQSWLAFDHYYSDLAFPDALPLVFAERPRRLLDVGGNTGRWAEQCARFNP